MERDPEPGGIDAGGLDLLADHEVVAEVDVAAPAVLDGDRHAQEAVLAGSHEDLARDDLGLFPFEVVRHDLLVEPASEAPSEELVLLVEQIALHVRHVTGRLSG